MVDSRYILCPAVIVLSISDIDIAINNLVNNL